MNREELDEIRGRFDLDTSKWKCEYCGKLEKPASLKLVNWQMQHLHFGDDTIKFLTCDDCKIKSPLDFLAKIEKRSAN